MDTGMSGRTVRVITIVAVACALAVGLSLALSSYSLAKVLSAPLASPPISVPAEVGFEGFLSDAGGDPFSDGAYTLTFRVYDAAVAGTSKWTETHTPVTVTSGYYAVDLGSITAFGSDTFSGTRWIGITVDGDSEMTPRTKVSSVPFALNADTVDGYDAADLFDADTVDGYDAAELMASAMPSGTIVMWAGAIEDIPTGWELCDGNDGTPDLRDRFIVGAGSTYSVDDTGGAATMAHTHQVDPPNTLSGVNNGTARKDGFQTGGNLIAPDGHRHYVDIATFTSGAASNTENRPPYYALVFIMKKTD